MTCNVIFYLTLLALTASVGLCQRTEPMLSLNYPLNIEQLQKLNNSVYIGQAALFILTGSYNGTESGLSALDDNSLDNILDAGLQLLVSILQKEGRLTEAEIQGFCIRFFC